jgi:hypothetical protein
VCFTSFTTTAVTKAGLATKYALYGVLFKGTVSRDGYFLKVFYMYKKPSNTEALTCDNIVLSMAVINWRRRRFSRSFKVFSLTYTKINFLFSSLKLLTNSEMLAETLLFCAR